MNKYEIVIMIQDALKDMDLTRLQDIEIVSDDQDSHHVEIQIDEKKYRITVEEVSAQPLASGTPSTLLQALTYAICTARGPQIAERFHAIVRDYLAQKFNTAMLRDTQAETEIRRLFQECVNE